MSAGPSHPSDLRFRQTSSELETRLSDEDKCNVYRRLVVQLGENVASNGWEGPSSLCQMRDLMMRTNALVDNQDGINNYSDFILNKPEMTNHSAEWESGLSLDDPDLQAIINKHPDRGPPREDKDWERCMKIDLTKENTKPILNLHRDDLPDTIQSSPPSKKFQFKSVKSEKTPETPESSFLNLPLDPKPLHSNRVETADFGRKNPTGPTSVPPRQTFAEKMLRGRGNGGAGGAGGRGGGRPNQPQGGDSEVEAPTFKPASHMLGAEERARRREGRGGITSSSYGSSKRQLGVGSKPVNLVAAAFKPPVKNSQNESGFHHSATPRSSTTTEDGETDPRYKNIDPKMVEMVENEIMETGETVEWDDIAGLEFAKATVKEIVVFPLLRPDIFTGLRGPPKGLLLFGPPGTGKTLIGKCIAHQSGCTFFSISSSSLTSKWVGEGEKMVRALFAVARVHQPSVVFIDEIDSLLTSRSEGEHESSRKMKTEFLVQLDGASTVGEERILVVGATNRPQELDDAARRRLVKRLYIPLPDEVARLHILTRLLSRGGEKCAVSREQMEDISQRTEGYSGADMANLCKEAAYGPIRSVPVEQIMKIRKEDVRPIDHSDLVAALNQVKASVSQQDLELYLDWDKKFGASK